MTVDTMPKDPYTILGLARDVSPEDIKKAYRRLSKEWHPDKHKGDKTAEDHFKEINEAYEILGSAERRSQYDRFGSTGNRGSQQSGAAGFDFGGFDFGNFNQSGDLGDLFGEFFGGGRRQQAAGGGADRQIEVTIDLRSVLHGERQTVRLQRMTQCGDCSGSGAKPGSATKTCADCGGTGQVTRTVQSFFGRIQQRAVCPTCEGRGQIPEQVCTRCRGEGRTMETSEISFDIPPGISDGQALRLSGEGDAGQRTAPSGDLLVLIRVRPDPRFRRDGADLYSDVAISVLDALLGNTKEIDTIHGTSTIQIAEGMQPGQVMRLRDKGLPVLNTSRFGDHFVTFHIEIPKKLSKAERKLLEEWRKMSDE